MWSASTVRPERTPRFVADEPLADAVSLSHEGMPPPLVLRWAEGFNALVAQHDGRISYGTAFSGSDIVHFALGTVAAYVKKQLGLDMMFEHKWACEAIPKHENTNQ